MSVAAFVVVASVCAWSEPGAARYTGDQAEAVEAYTDIPPESRARLRIKVQAHAYDDHVVITRDDIESKRYAYRPELTGMHFGSKGLVCASVNRSKWRDGAFERALVYCDGPYCVAIPSVCGNVSRVTRLSESEPLRGIRQRQEAPAISTVPAKVHQVPLPSTAWLVLAGVVALASLRKGETK